MRTNKTMTENLEQLIESLLALCFYGVMFMVYASLAIGAMILPFYVLSLIF